MNYYPPQWFEEMRHACHDAVLSDPWPSPRLAFSAVVPAEWCPPGNKRDKMHWKHAQRMKQSVKSIMQRQAPREFVTPFGGGQPLGGRPVVHVIRFTQRRTDPRSNWDKFPVDALTPYKRIQTKDGPKTFGCLGIIADDSGDHIDLRAEWRKSKLGVVYVRVFASL